MRIPTSGPQVINACLFIGGWGPLQKWSDSKHSTPGYHPWKDPRWRQMFDQQTTKPRKASARRRLRGGKVWRAPGRRRRRPQAASVNVVSFLFFFFFSFAFFLIFFVLLFLLLFVLGFPSKQPPFWGIPFFLGGGSHLNWWEDQSPTAHAHDALCAVPAASSGPAARP